MREVPVGVIGAAGYMGKRFVSIVASHPGARLVAVADLDRAGVEGLEVPDAVRRYTDYRAMLEAALDIEAVIVATPDGMHAEPCLACFEHGLHVLVEKPLATTVDDGVAIVKAARASGRVLLVGHTLRFDPRYLQAYASIRAGEIGELVYLTARRIDFLRSAQRIKGRTSAMFFLGVHDIDVLHWFCGERVSRVVAARVSKRLGELGVEDAMLVQVRFPSGIIAALEVSWLLPDSMGKSDAQLEVVGTSGAIFVDLYSTGLRIHGPSAWRQPDTIFAPNLGGRVRGALYEEVGHFLDCVSGRAAPAISPDDALAAVRVAARAHDSADRDGVPQSIEWASGEP